MGTYANTFDVFKTNKVFIAFMFHSEKILITITGSRKYYTVISWPVHVLTAEQNNLTFCYSF